MSSDTPKDSDTISIMMEKTRAVNVKNRNCDVYIGRANKTYDENKPSLFCNPFRLQDGFSREQAIEFFRAYFYYRLEHDEKFRKAVQKLKGKTLGCWCHPKACHGDVIVEYLEGLEDAAEEQPPAEPAEE